VVALWTSVSGFCVLRHVFQLEECRLMGNWRGRSAEYVFRAQLARP